MIEDGEGFVWKLRQVLHQQPCNVFNVWSAGVDDLAVNGWKLTDLRSSKPMFHNVIAKESGYQGQRCNFWLTV